MSANPWIRNPGPKTPVTGLKTAVSTDSAVVTETMRQVLREGGNAADAGVAGALLQAAVEPFMTHHAGTVTYLDHDAATGRHHQLHSGHPVSTFEHGVFGAMELGILRHLGMCDTGPGQRRARVGMAHALRVASDHPIVFHDPVVPDHGVDPLLDDGFRAHLARPVRGMKRRIDLTRHVELAAGGGAAGRPTLDRLAADTVAQLKSWDATVRAVPGCDHRVGS
jgi:hypothetical protein